MVDKIAIFIVSPCHQHRTWKDRVGGGGGGSAVIHGVQNIANHVGRCDRASANDLGYDDLMGLDHHHTELSRICSLIYVAFTLSRIDVLLTTDSLILQIH